MFQLEIRAVHPTPEMPKENDIVTFQVEVYNNMKDKNINLTLYVDGSEVDLVSGNVSAGSTREFSLHWSVEAEEHSYEVKLYGVEKGKEVLEDREGGKIKGCGATGVCG
jgi:hypothetical protein